MIIRRHVYSEHLWAYWEERTHNNSPIFQTFFLLGGSIPSHHPAQLRWRIIGVCHQNHAISEPKKRLRMTKHTADVSHGLFNYP